MLTSAFLKYVDFFEHLPRLLERCAIQIDAFDRHQEISIPVLGLVNFTICTE